MMSAPWRVVGASVQGTSHQEGDVPCQDAQATRVTPQGALIVAVADGAGTAARSDEGARRVVERAVVSLEEALRDRPALADQDAGWRALMIGAFGDARASLDQIVADEGGSLRDFATTLICAVAAGDWLVVGQIGDGAAVAADASGGLFVALRPRRGEYANEAYFLTMSGFVDYVDVAVYAQAVSALAVTTDGLLRLALKLPGHVPFAPFFRPLLAFAAEAADKGDAEEQLAGFLASERVCARTDDDKTLVLAVRTLATTPVASGGATTRTDDAEPLPDDDRL